MHQVLYFVSDNTGEGDSDGVFRAGDSQDVLLVDAFNLNAFFLGCLGFYIPIDDSFLGHSGEGEGKEKKDGDCKFVGFHWV